MYMEGLGANVDICARAPWLSMCQGQSGGAGTWQSIGTMTEGQCRERGGTASNCRVESTTARPSSRTGDFDYAAKSRGLFLCECKVFVPAPAPAPAPPAQITVSPQISTQVSPQISPVFQQQFQPTNSPATAGTTQVSAPSVAPAASQLPPVPVPAQAPVYTAPPAPMYAPPPAEQLPPVPVQYPAGGGGGSYYEAPQTSIEPTQPQQPTFDWKIAAIIGLGLFGVAAMSGKQKR